MGFNTGQDAKPPPQKIVIPKIFPPLAMRKYLPPSTLFAFTLSLLD
jgi:hypothetical protein